jgi:triphosphoribosyl-dephospho-CoA synthase
MTPIGLHAQLACIWEATARKPGNVHRERDFADTTYLDFLVSAAAIAPVMERAPRQRVGQTILDAVKATRVLTAANTNLGIILLLAPLAAVPDQADLRAGVADVLAGLDVEDARLTYQAIRLAKPGGLGQASEQDVHREPTQTLREVMALAADRDRIARQYADGYREVFDEGVPALQDGLSRTGELEGAIILCHLYWLAHHPDRRGARKLGLAVAPEAPRRARQVGRA